MGQGTGQHDSCSKKKWALIIGGALVLLTCLFNGYNFGPQERSTTDSNDEDLKQQLLGLLSSLVPNLPDQAASNWTVEGSGDGLESENGPFQPKGIYTQTTIEAIPFETNETVPAVSGEGKYTMPQELSSGNETQEAVPPDPSQRHDEEPTNMQSWNKKCFRGAALPPGQEGTPPDSLASVAKAPEKRGYKLYIYSETFLGIDGDLSTSTSGSPQQNCLMQYLHSHLNRTSSPEEADLFIVPMYYSSSGWLDSDGKDQESRLRVMYDNIASSHWYMRRGGADHIFVCPSPSCVEVESIMIDKFSVDVFSFWAGPASTKGITGRRCPYRFIPFDAMLPGDDVDLTQNNCSAENGAILASSGADHRVDAMLSEVFAKVRGRDLWKCGGKREPQLNDSFGAPANNRAQAYNKGVVLDTAHNFVFCYIPKCASTALKMMMKRVLGVPHWRSLNSKCIHHRPTNGLTHLDKQSSAQVHEIFDDAKWVKAVLVRDPVIRTLSAYLQKIVELKMYNTIHWHKKRPPTFTDYVNQLYLYPSIMARNAHYGVQSANCGLRYTKYNYIAKVETIRPDIEELFRRLGLWDQYGATGWGANGTDSFLASFVYAQNHDRPLSSSGSDLDVASYYTKDTLKKVHKMYKEDFDRFGYSYNKWLDILQ